MALRTFHRSSFHKQCDARFFYPVEDNGPGTLSILDFAACCDETTPVPIMLKSGVGQAVPEYRLAHKAPHSVASIARCLP
jgi:hypothetical protein